MKTYFAAWPVGTFAGGTPAFFFYSGPLLVGPVCAFFIDDLTSWEIGQELGGN